MNFDGKRGTMSQGVSCRTSNMCSEYLDNQIECTKMLDTLPVIEVCKSSEGESEMATKRTKYVIDGRVVTISGNSEQERAEKYAMMLLRANNVDAHSLLSNTMESAAQYSAAYLTSKIPFTAYVVDNTARAMGLADKHLLRDISDEWLAAKKTRVGAKTYTNYERHWRMILAHFKGAYIEDIRRRELQEFFNALNATKSASTVQEIKICFDGVFQWALSDGYIQKNPLSDKRLVITGKPKIDRDAIPPDIYMRILSQLPTIDKPSDRAFMSIIAYTGARRGEVLALKWEDIDLENRLIHIKQAWALSADGNNAYLKPPKTKAGVRAIPMLDGLIDIIKPIREAFVQEHSIEPTGFVTTKDDGELHTQVSFRRMMERIKKQVELGKYTSHFFRHTVTSQLGQSNIPIKTIQRMMGHANIETTLNIYSHVNTSDVQTAGEAFEDRLSYLTRKISEHA